MKNVKQFYLSNRFLKLGNIFLLKNYSKAWLIFLNFKNSQKEMFENSEILVFKREKTFMDWIKRNFEEINCIWT